MIFCLLPLLILQTLTLNFSTGMAFLQGAPTYNVSVSQKTSFLAISIASFNSLSNVTACSIAAQAPYFSTVACTPNIQSFSFIIIQRTSSILVDSYAVYFFKEDASQQYVIDLTLLSRNAPIVIVPFITGIERNPSLHSYIKAKQNGSTIVLTRSLNIRMVVINYIVLVIDPSLSSLNYPALSAGTQLQDSSVSFPYFGAFVAIQMNATQPLFYSLSPTIANQSGNSFSSSKSSSLELDLFSLVLSNDATCSMRFVAKGISSTLLYCLLAGSDLPFASIVGNNLKDIGLFAPEGCSEPVLNATFDIICISCRKGYYLRAGRCVCNYGTISSNSTCIQCSNCTFFGQSSLLAKPTATLSLVDTSLLVTFPQFLSYEESISAYVLPSLLINGVTYNASLEWSNEWSVNITASGVPAQSHYTAVMLTLPFILVSLSSSFFASISSSAEYSPAITLLTAMESLKPIFTYSSSAVPLIFIIAAFIGEKVNGLGLFQTSSLLYLINFMDLGGNYTEINSVLSSLFLFAPSPLLKLVPKMQAIPADYRQTPKLYLYTNQQMIISANANHSLGVTLQIVLVQLLLSLTLCLCRRKPNRVQDQSGEQQASLDFKIERSKIGKDGYIRWIKMPELRDPSLRAKIVLYLTSLHQKRYITITSLLMPQICSASLLAYTALATPISTPLMLGEWLYAWLLLFSLLLYPLLLLNSPSLQLLKTVRIIYKRKKYTHGQIWLYLCLVYFEGMVASLAIALLQGVPLQALTIAAYLFLKCALMIRCMKVLELARNICLVVLFTLVAATAYFPNAAEALIIKQIIVFMLIATFATEVLKIMRNIIVLAISFFKSKVQARNQKKEAVEPEIRLPIQELKSFRANLQNEYENLKNRKLKRMMKDKENIASIVVHRAKQSEPAEPEEIIDLTTRTGALICRNG